MPFENQYLITEMEGKIKQLEEENQRLLGERRWIPVTKRLPDTAEDVLIYLGGEQIGTASYHGRRHGWYSIDLNITQSGPEFGKYVTHWMPLPSPPEEEDE